MEFNKIDGEWVIANEESIFLESMNIDSSKFNDFEELLENVA